MPRSKKSSLVSVNQPGEKFYHLPARTTECVSYVFFVSNKKKTQTKSKKTRENWRKEKENVVFNNVDIG